MKKLDSFNSNLYNPDKIIPQSTDPAAALTTDVQAEQSIKKARALLSSQNKINQRAANLIQMAESALKNGNFPSAKDFAGKVLTMLSIENQDIPDPKPEKKDPRIPTPVSRGKKPGDSPEKKKSSHTYQDISNDPGVSFSYPAKLSGPQSFLAVPAHEYEHVRNSIGEAVLNGKKVMVLVSYTIRYDPGTGEPYMAGGVTRTIHYPDIPNPGKGENIDTLA